MSKLVCEIVDEPYFDPSTMYQQTFPFWFIERLHEKGVSIYARNLDWTVAIEWCEGQFGPKDVRWAGEVSLVVRNYICFVHPDDAFAFRLRWC